MSKPQHLRVLFGLYIHPRMKQEWLCKYFGRIQNVNRQSFPNDPRPWQQSNRFFRLFDFCIGTLWYYHHNYHHRTCNKSSKKNLTNPSPNKFDSFAPERDSLLVFFYCKFVWNAVPAVINLWLYISTTWTINQNVEHGMIHSERKSPSDTTFYFLIIKKWGHELTFFFSLLGIWTYSKRSARHPIRLSYPSVCLYVLYVCVSVGTEKAPACRYY